MALVSCWGNVADISDEYRDGIISRRQATSKTALRDNGSLKDELLKVSRLFVQVVERDVDMKLELEPLIQAEPKLGDLFSR